MSLHRASVKMSSNLSRMVYSRFVLPTYLEIPSSRYTSYNYPIVFFTLSAEYMCRMLRIIKLGMWYRVGSFKTFHFANDAPNLNDLGEEHEKNGLAKRICFSPTKLILDNKNEVPISYLVHLLAAQSTSDRQCLLVVVNGPECVLLCFFSVSGLLTNTGHSVAFRVSDVQPGVPINISGGPLSYKYRFHELHLHYGRTDDRGSEHTVSGTSFPGESKRSLNQYISRGNVSAFGYRAL
ncbi:UNVERIFIED_CONTAM: Carbonic anhydrase-related protein 10 [Trichonephila clavipes]